MGPGFSYGPDDWFRSRMGWGLSPFTAGTEAEYQLPHYAAVDISRREKGETSWREASCFDSGDVKHEAERKNRVDGSRHCKCGGFFKEPVENLVSDSAIEAISGGSEYLMRHNAASDISRRELAASAGSRTSVLNVQVLEDEHKSPLLKWDRTFSLSGSIRDGVEYLMRGNLASDISRYGVDPTGSSAMAMRRLAA